jgi:hypothetical protein
MIREWTIAVGRRALLCAAVLAGLMCVEAAKAETYVVLSLVGDRVTVVGLGAQLGSHIDQSRREVIPIQGTGLDDFVIRVADQAIAKARPEATVVALRAGDPTLYKLRDSWLDSDSVEVKDLMSFLPQSALQSPDTRLLLITPYRDELELGRQNNVLGIGKVGGLGFFLDTITRSRRSDTMETGVGYLGIFAHFQLTLINLPAGGVDAHERVVLGTTRSAARAADRSVWNAVSQEDKSRLLESLLKRGIEQSLPRMLSSKKQ